MNVDEAFTVYRCLKLLHILMFASVTCKNKAYTLAHLTNKIIFRSLVIHVAV